MLVSHTSSGGETELDALDPDQLLSRSAWSSSVLLFIGVMLFTYYQHVPLPRTLTRSDEVLPLFIVTALSHGAGSCASAGCSGCRRVK